MMTSSSGKVFVKVDSLNEQQVKTEISLFEVKCHCFRFVGESQEQPKKFQNSSKIHRQGKLGRPTGTESNFHQVKIVSFKIGNKYV